MVSPPPNEEEGASDRKMGREGAEHTLIVLSDHRPPVQSGRSTKPVCDSCLCILFSFSLPLRHLLLHSVGKGPEVESGLLHKVH